MAKSLRFYIGILIFSVIISIPFIIPYLHSGYFPTHDGEWAVVRLSDMFRELRDLQIPPRFSGNLNFSYGYPLFNFAYPFPYYIGVLIHMLGVGFIDTIKIIFAASVPLSAFFMFLASRNVWKNDWAGIISSVLYLYFPYRLVDLFVRGSIGETVAFVLFPLILYCISKLVNDQKAWQFKIIGGISFAALILSHNIMAVLFLLTLGIVCLAYLTVNKIVIIKNLIFIAVTGFILSAFFSLPALLEKNNILLSQIPIANRDLYFVSLSKLLFSPWGYGVPTDKLNGFTYQLGWPFLLVIFVLIGLLVFKFFKERIKRDETLFVAVLLMGILLLTLFMFKPFGFVWKLPLLSEINYPWTMLSQLGFLTAILAGFLSKYKITKAAAFGAIFLALYLYLPLTKPEKFIDREDGYYFTNDATTTSSNELMPLWVKNHPNKRPDKKIEILNGEGAINNVNFNSKKISAEIVISEGSSIRINTIYYPGWELFIDNKKTDVNYNNNLGVMDISLKPGKYKLSGTFSETPIRVVSDLISIGGVLFIFAFSIWKLRFSHSK